MLVGNCLSVSCSPPLWPRIVGAILCAFGIGAIVGSAAAALLGECHLRARVNVRFLAIADTGALGIVCLEGTLTNVSSSPDQRTPDLIRRLIKNSAYREWWLATDLYVDEWLSSLMSAHRQVNFTHRCGERSAPKLSSSDRVTRGFPQALAHNAKILLQPPRRY